MSEWRHRRIVTSHPGLYGGINDPATCADDHQLWPCDAEVMAVLLVKLVAHCEYAMSSGDATNEIESTVTQARAALERLGRPVLG